MRAQVISFHCVMKDRLGKVLSSSYNQEVINQSECGHDGLTGLVDGLQAVHEGEERKISLTADSAYGRYDTGLVLTVKRSDLAAGQELSLGSRVLWSMGNKAECRSFRVVQLDGDTVILDGNHPLAGQDLVFEVRITSAREARDEDYEHSGMSSMGSWIH